MCRAHTWINLKYGKDLPVYYHMSESTVDRLRSLDVDALRSELKDVGIVSANWMLVDCSSVKGVVKILFSLGLCCLPQCEW